MGNFITRLANECVWEKQGCANEMWNEMTVMVRKVAKEILGESKGIIRSDKETWWWNEKVQEKIKFKKQCFKDIHMCDNEETWEKYRLAKRGKKRRERSSFYSI